MLLPNESRFKVQMLCCHCHKNSETEKAIRSARPLSEKAHGAQCWAVPDTLSFHAALCGTRTRFYLG